MDANRAVLSYAREAIKAKNDVIFSQTDWEEKQHKVRVVAYQNILKLAMKQINDQTLLEKLGEIIQYIDATSKQESQRLMHKANALVKQLTNSKFVR